MENKELEDLQTKYYEFFTELKKAKPALSENAYNYMANQIFSQYKVEAELLSLRLALESEKEKYGLLYQQGRLIPRRRRKWIFWSKPNTAALLLENELEREIQREFDERANDLWGNDEELLEEDYFEGGLGEDVPTMDYSEGEYSEEQERLNEPTDLLIEVKTET